MKVIVDEGVPRRLVGRCETLASMRIASGKRQISNGALIAAIEVDGYGVLLTNDKNIANQQSLNGRGISVVALPLNRRAAIMAKVADIVDTIRRAKPGQHTVMGLGRLAPCEDYCRWPCRRRTLARSAHFQEAIASISFCETL